MTGEKEKALELLARSLSFNDRAPNDALWEYVSTLYEVYDPEVVNKELILKPFIENKYQVTNINYGLVKRWFDNKHYRYASAASEFFDIESIPLKNRSEFYYIWGKALWLLNQREEALEIFAKSLSYNDREPNDALWKYSTTLYELYEGKNINGELILQPFDKNNYKVTNIDYDLLKRWFQREYYKKALVAFELADLSTIPEEKQSHIYYMWGRMLRLAGDKKRALRLLAKSLSFNDIAPNSALWEYVSTLYEAYSPKVINRELILKPFIENKYQVTNVRYEMVKKWFDNKHYRHAAVACEFIDVAKLSEEEKKKIDVIKNHK